MRHGRLSLAAKQLVAVAPPSGLVYRVARGLDPFEPPDWCYTGRNRFDDPRGPGEVTSGGRFRMLYLATRSAGAFGETIAGYRTDFQVLAALGEIEDDEPLDPCLQPGVVPADYRSRRQLGNTRLDLTLRFVDLHDAETVQALRPVLAPFATRYGLSDVDLSTIVGPQRELTQQVALHVYGQTGPDGRPLYAGVRYLSRLNSQWELWAAFSDRLLHTPGVPEVIHPDHPGLVEAAAILGVTIEALDDSHRRILASV